MVRDSNAYVANWTYLNARGQPDSVLTGYCGSCGYYRLRYAYTNAGLLDSVWAWGSFNPPFLSRKYGYNTLRGTLDSIRLGGALTTFSLNNDLQPSTVTFPGGDQVTRSFTALHGEMVINTAAGYGSSIERRVTLDTPGRLWRQLHESAQQGHLYGYDGLGRLAADTLMTNDNAPPCEGETELIGAECANFYQQWLPEDWDTFVYDSVGNRRDQGGAYGPGNRITAFGGCTYLTDADGNVTRRTCSGQTDSIVWDALNRPTRFLVNGVAYDLFYDASGRPVRQDSAGVVRRYFLWDGNNLFAELDVPGNKVAEYSYYPGQDNLHAVILGSTPYYAHTDGLGNIVSLTNGQSVAREYAYDAWGQETGGQDLAGFNGRDRARFKGALSMGMGPAQFYYMRNRWYEPNTGRFLSEDPIGLAGGLNPYTFAANDPVNGRDPTGLMLGGCWTETTGWLRWYDNGDVEFDPLFKTVECEDRPPIDDYPGGGVPEENAVPQQPRTVGPSCDAALFEAVAVTGIDIATIFGLWAPATLAVRGALAFGKGLAMETATTVVRAQAGYIVSKGVAAPVTKAALGASEPFFTGGASTMAAAGVLAADQATVLGVKAGAYTAAQNRHIGDLIPGWAMVRAWQRYAACQSQ